jgi:hypothetical protein
MHSSVVVRLWRVVTALGLVVAELLLPGAAQASTATCKRTPLPNVRSDYQLKWGVHDLFPQRLGGGHQN